MVKVSLILKTFDKDSNESKKELIDSKEFQKPKNYGDFISDITKCFKIKNKEDISLMVFTTDEDENPIHDQEDLDNFEALEYRVIINNENDSGEKGEIIREGPKDEIDINLKINMEISEKELEKFIDEQIKIFPEIENQNINDDIQFDIKKYKEKLENKNINIIKNFNNSLNSKINDIIINKSNFMKETINNSVLKFSKTHIEQIKKINNETQGIKEDFSEIIFNSNQMNKSLEILKEGIEISKIINSNHEIKPPYPEVNEVKPQNEIINQNPKIKPQNNRENINNIDDDDEDDIPVNLNKLTIKFVNENINLEINKKTANFFEIQNIKIENIGTETYKKLFFEKDENNSSKDIYFYENSSNLNRHKLSLNGDFEPSGKENHTFILQIKYPKPSQVYTLYIYAKDDNGNNLSKALKINVKIMEEKEEDDQKILIENAKKLLPELENKYNFSIILTEEKVLQKLIELKNNLESISKWISDEFGKKSEELYKEFKMETICDKNEGIEKIEELKYDKGKLTEWLKIQKIENKKEKIEALYNKLIAEFDFIDDIFVKNEMIIEIIAKNFDKEIIKEWIESRL